MRVLAIAAILVAVAVQVVLAAPARAHATLVSSEPADGAVIPAAPPRLTLTFNEPVSPLALRLVAPDSASTAVQAVTERETSLAIALPSGLRDGTHVLSWRVVSLDGHPCSRSAHQVPVRDPRCRARCSQPSPPLNGRSKSFSTSDCLPGPAAASFLHGLLQGFVVEEPRSGSACWRDLSRRRCWSGYRARMRWSCRYRAWQTGRHGRRGLELRSAQRPSPLRVHCSRVLRHFKREAPARFRCSVSLPPALRWR